MKTLVLLLAGCMMAVAVSAQDLGWPELARRPELWPAQCSVKAEIKFEGGVSVKAGEKVDVVAFKANEVDVRTADGKVSFAAAPDETDVLAVARDGYAKLTPKQRQLTYASLVQRKDLWPDRVALTTMIDLGGGKALHKGDQIFLIDVQSDRVKVWSDAFNTILPIAPQATDLMAQARALVEGNDKLTPKQRELNYTSLVQRKDLWPDRVALAATFDIGGGKTVHKEDQLFLLEVQPDRLKVWSDTLNATLPVVPQATDLMAQARALLEENDKLTPKQKEVTYASLAQRKELWPYRVTLAATFTMASGQTVRKGDEVVLMDVQPGMLTVLAEKPNISFKLPPQVTDLLAQARKFAEDKQGAPPRVFEEIQGKLISSVTGEPTPLDASLRPKYYVFYRGASTCGFTKAFAPTLMKYYTEMKPKHPEFEIIYVTADDTVAAMQQFSKEEGFSWRSLTLQTGNNMPLFGNNFGTQLSHLVVMNGDGKVLIDGAQTAAPAALQQLDALLKQPAPQN